MKAKKDESEWRTRKKRIDPKLDAAGWKLSRGGGGSLRHPFRTEEEETDAGPADYALWLDNGVVGVVEAKKLTVPARALRGRSSRARVGQGGCRAGGGRVMLCEEE